MLFTVGRQTVIFGHRKRQIGWIFNLIVIRLVFFYRPREMYILSSYAQNYRKHQWHALLPLFVMEVPLRHSSTGAALTVLTDRRFQSSTFHEKICVSECHIICSLLKCRKPDDQYISIWWIIIDWNNNVSLFQESKNMTW